MFNEDEFCKRWRRATPQQMLDAVLEMRQKLEFERNEKKRFQAALDQSTAAQEALQERIEELEEENEYLEWDFERVEQENEELQSRVAELETELEMLEWCWNREDEDASNVLRVNHICRPNLACVEEDAEVDFYEEWIGELQAENREWEWKNDEHALQIEEFEELFIQEVSSYLDEIRSLHNEIYALQEELDQLEWPTLRARIEQEPTYYVASQYSSPPPLGPHKKFHCPECKWAKRIEPRNRLIFKSRIEAKSAQYKPCGTCGA